MGTVISINSGGGPSLVKSFFETGVFSQVTGTTANTLTGAVLIPQNTIDENIGAVVEFTTRIIKSGGNGIATLRVYINTVDNLSGAALLATGAAAPATELFQQLSRTLFITKSPGGTSVLDPATGGYTPDTRTTPTQANLNVDWTVDQYIILAVQNASTADTSVGAGIIAKIYTK